MEEFQLTEAEYSVGEFHISFSRKRSAPPAASHEVSESIGDLIYDTAPTAVAAGPTVKGTPVISPMSGIFYIAPSPGSPPFVKIGDTITEGQPIGLIEAMKVFNEIPSTAVGTVLEIVAEPGAIVQVGDVLLRVG